MADQPNSFFNSLARAHFDDARRREWLSALRDALLHAPHELLALEEVRNRLQIRGQRHIGLCTVPLDQIIGSEGRYGDFDRHFLPRSDHIRDRWMNVDMANQLYIDLPPIDLYKIGDVYFVRDGNHRVSVARRQGQTDIDANVDELLIDVPLDASLRLDELPIKEEYADFLDWTQLHVMRPQQRIEFSEQGGYLELIRHINGHRYFMGKELNRPIASEEAVASWYDDVYMPVIQAIRAHDVLNRFPGRTEADLYRWIMEHRWYMLESAGGKDPGPDQAVQHFTDQYGTHNWFSQLGRRIGELLR